MALLQIEDLTFYYPDTERPALQNISFSVEPGEFTVICGVSGCGKSTLLRLIKHTLAPFGTQSGRILYNGQPPQARDERADCAEIGFVQQRPENQIVTDTVWHEVAFGLESLGLPSPVIRRRVSEMAAYFGMEHWFRQSTAELSGGQKQLLNLAGVMVMQPKLLLLDEPTAQLDPIAATDFIGTLHRLSRELGVTVLLAEHRLEEVLPLADRVILMEDGRAAFDGPPRHLVGYFERHDGHPMTCALPAATRIFCSLQSGEDGPLTVREGRRYLVSHFGNARRFLPETPAPAPRQVGMTARGIWFRYEKEAPDILRDVSLEVFTGEHLCLLGGNGAGKTTLLEVLSGVRKPYRGSVTLAGKKLSSYGDRTLYHRCLAVLPQDPQTVFLKKTVREDLAEACQAMAYERCERDAQITKVAERLGIGDLLDRHPYDLSGGEQQKAALAKLLVLQPRWLFLDEPTKGMDAYGRENFADVLSGLKRDGITVLTVTHDVEFAAAHADRCAFLFDGEVMSVDTPQAFFADNTFYTTAANRMVKGYYDNAILCEDVIRLCRLNGRKEVLAK